MARRSMRRQLGPVMRALGGGRLAADMRRATLSSEGNPVG